MPKTQLGRWTGAKWTAAGFPVTLRARARLRGPPVHLVAVDTAAEVDTAVGAVAIDSRTKFVATSNAVAATEDQAVGTSILVRADRAPPRPAGAVVVAAAAVAAAAVTAAVANR